MLYIWAYFILGISCLDSPCGGYVRWDSPCPQKSLGEFISFFSQARDSVRIASTITVQYWHEHPACQMWFMIRKYPERPLLLCFIDVVISYTFSSFSDTSKNRVGRVIFIQMDRSIWHLEAMHIYGFLYDVSSRFHHRRRDVLLPSQRQVDDYFFQVSLSS